MSNKIWIIALAMIMSLASTACKPGGTGGGSGGSKERPDYLLTVRVLDKGANSVTRRFHCTIIGYSGKNVVVLVDDKTKKTKPYEIEIEDITPKTIRLIDNAKTDRIEFICDMTGGRSGDVMYCQVATDGGGAVAMFGHKKEAEIKPDGTALCAGTINARS